MPAIFLSLSLHWDQLWWAQLDILVTVSLLCFVTDPRHSFDEVAVCIS